MPHRVQFGVYELDLDGLELRKHGVPIRLQDQPLQILVALIERPGETVTREQLQERIWGKDTFVDFDQSLNKAVNRLREALNDDPAQPRYVETVPRRGYRFIAPVNTGFGLNGHGISGQAPSEKNLLRRSSWPRIAILSMTAACIAGITGVLLFSRGSTARIPQEPRRMSSFGFMPALSPDGRLLAYAGSPDGGLPHIWIQQVSGGGATQLTNGPEFDVVPDFSPDGTQIVFYSERNGGGIYLVPSLSGESKLVVAGHNLAGPRFSPSGNDILYWNDFGIYTVKADGGDPVALPINSEYRVYAPPFWSPDGTEILFCGARKDQNQPGTWWIASAKEPRVKPADLPEVGKNSSPLDAVRAWIRLTDGRDWIIYSTSTTDAWKLWEIPVLSHGVVSQERALLASGTGWLATGAAASMDGRLTWGIWHVNHSIYQISMGGRGQKLGPTLQLPLAQGGSHRSPSLSHDGKWMAYDSAETAKPNAIVLRNLISGTNQVLDDKGRDSLDGGDASISPDGSKVVFTRDCGDERWWPDDPSVVDPCSFLLAVGKSTPEPVCRQCEPRGFAPDGSSVLVQKYPGTDVHKFRIDSIDLRTKAEKEFLSDPENPLFHAFLSWDGRWVVFKKLWLDRPGTPGQIFITSVRQGVAGSKSKWIAVTDGKRDDDKPQFSSDGNTIYFTSPRDGYLCIWAQRLNPVTKRPIGEPFAYEHFHNASGRSAPVYNPSIDDLSVSSDKMMINLPQVQSDVWMKNMK